jgi:branched-chain amino acid transport system substrate-binding protein
MSTLLTRRSLIQGTLASATLLNCKGCQRGGGTGTGTGTGGSSDSIKVGFLATLSGAQGGIGKELQQGLAMYLESVNRTAGGRTIELIERDDKNDPQVAVGIVKELVANKVPVIIGPSHSHVMLGIRNVVHESKTILLNPNAGAASVAGAECSPYIFTTGRMNPLYAEALGRYLAKAGIAKVAVLAANVAAGIDMVKGFKDAYEGEGGGKVVGEVLPPANTTDFAPHIEKLKSFKPDAVFAFVAGEGAIHFIKGYSAAGLKGKLPLYVTGYTVEQDVLEQEGESALGVLSISVYAPMLDNSVNRKFAPAYKLKYNTYPSEYSVLAYDAGQLLVSAVNALGGKVDDKVSLMSAITMSKIESPRGPFKLGPNQTPVQDAYLREVTRAPDGRLVNKSLAVAWPGYYYPGEGCTLPGVKH